MSGLKSIKKALPVYNITLPASGQKVKFRPFTVREEKTLMIALQEDDPSQHLATLQNVIGVCTNNTVDINKLATADAEYLFINIRNKSVGEGLDVNAKCTECDATNLIDIDLSKITVKKTDIKPEIQLSEKLWVTMKFPTLETAFGAIKKTSETDQIEIIAECLVSVIDGEEAIDCSEETLADKVDFVEGLMHDELQKLAAFIEAAPRVMFTGDFTCIKCGHKNIMQLEGMESFFD